MPDSVESVRQITERELQVLVKMLGLLGSDQAGERAAAALKVDQWVRTRGLDWSELLIPPEPEPEPVAVRVTDAPFDVTSGTAAFTQAQAAAKAHWAAAQAAAQAVPGLDWVPQAESLLLMQPQVLRGSGERLFLESQIQRAKLYGPRMRLSDKQRAWLADILARVGFTL
jgi:hypothetical protein